MDRKYIELLMEMIAIPAVSRDEHARSDFLENWMKKEGLQVDRIHNNLLVGDPVGDPAGGNVLLNSHMDTVDPVEGWQTDPFDPVLEGERITGLGSNDAGGSVVALIAAYRKILPTYRGKAGLYLLISAEEEVSGEKGIRSVLGSMPPFDAVLVGEPTGMNPAIAERGLLVLDGTISGVAGHAARNEGVNAIYLAMKDIESIRNLKFSRESEWLPGPGAQVTVIRGGTRHNVVPDGCHYVVDLRSNDQYGNQELLELLRSVCRAELEPRSTGLDASSLAKDHFLMNAIRDCRLEPFGSSTLSDMALIPYPSVKLGPGDSARSHTAGEYITLPELDKGVATYCRFLNSIGTFMNRTGNRSVKQNQTASR